VPRIEVDPDRLQELSSRLQIAAEEMAERDAQLDRTIDALDWEVRSRPGIEAEVWQARQQAQQLMGAAHDLSRFLARKAEAFLQADEESARSLSHGATAGLRIEDGLAPAPAERYAARGDGVPLTSDRRWIPVDAAITCPAEARSQMTPTERRERYDQVLDQFNVEENPRYKPGKDTYCNIFVTDATRAMGAEIPHWVMPGDGAPVPPGTKGAEELDANKTARWLESHGPSHGWRLVPAEQAQAHANDGRPAVVVLDNGTKIGHVAMVRPGEFATNSGCAIANVGASNKAHSQVADRFGTTSVKYWIHD